MKRVILIFFIVCVNSLMADLEDHLKKPTDKFCVHSLKGIDFIYVINLDQRPEKFALCSLQLNAFGIQPYRFSAVNGWELSLEAISHVGIKYEPWITHDHWGTYYSGEGEFRHEIVQTDRQKLFFPLHVARRNWHCAESSFLCCKMHILPNMKQFG